MLQKQNQATNYPRNIKIYIYIIYTHAKTIVEHHMCQGTKLSPQRVRPKAATVSESNQRLRPFVDGFEAVELFGNQAIVRSWKAHYNGHAQAVRLEE